MVENFNGIIYLIVFIVHFLLYAIYAYRLVFDTKSFLDKYGMDHTAAIMTRFLGSFFIGSTLIAIYILFRGTEGTWTFFNLIFLQNLTALIINFYSIKINKLGVDDKTSTDSLFHFQTSSIGEITMPGILMILSTILIYGLSDKIYS